MYRRKTSCEQCVMEDADGMRREEVPEIYDQIMSTFLFIRYVALYLVMCVDLFLSSDDENMSSSS
jgi:hypothetical protein